MPWRIACCGGPHAMEGPPYHLPSAGSRLRLLLASLFEIIATFYAQYILKMNSFLLSFHSIPITFLRYCCSSFHCPLFHKSQYGIELLPWGKQLMEETLLNVKLNSLATRVLMGREVFCTIHCLVFFPH